MIHTAIYVNFEMSRKTNGGRYLPRDLPWKYELHIADHVSFSQSFAISVIANLSAFHFTTRALTHDARIWWALHGRTKHPAQLRPGVFAKWCLGRGRKGQWRDRGNFRYG